MTKEIATVLRRRLEGVSFFDLMAGIAQPVVDVKFNDVSVVTIKRKMPVSYDIATGKSQFLGMERQLIPDQGKKSILYFEDFGTSRDSSYKGSSRSIGYISNIRLIAWINKTKCDIEKYAEITALSIDQINHRLCLGKGINENGIQRLFVRVSRTLIQDAAIFSRYNYDESVLGFLRPPFEFFAIDYECRYTANATTCTGRQYTPNFIGQRITALIVDEPNEKAYQFLSNGDVIRKEYAPGLTLTILDKDGNPYLRGKKLLSTFVFDNGHFQDEPFDINTGTFDHTANGGFSSDNNPGIITFDVNIALK